jgi:hypothetical protein
MEKLMLKTLEWNVNPVTPHVLVHQIVPHLALPEFVPAKDLVEMVEDILDASHLGMGLAGNCCVCKPMGFVLFAQK